MYIVLRKNSNSIIYLQNVIYTKIGISAQSTGHVMN